MTERRPSSLDGVRRLAVYGVTGSGKTTLARRLADVADVPFHSVDDLTWEPGWTEVPVDEQLRRIREVVAGDAWILDSVYASMFDDVLPRLDLLIALDYRRMRSLRRLTWRTGRRMIRREEICNGNHESLRRTFSRESIIAWHVRSFPHRRDQIAAWTRSTDGPPVVRLRSPREAERWLAELARRSRQVGSA